MLSWYVHIVPAKLKLLIRGASNAEMLSGGDGAAYPVALCSPLPRLLNYHKASSLQPIMP